MYTTGLFIPSKRDVGGYDYDEHGVFRKNSVIEHKPTDFYDIPRGVWRCRAFCFIKNLANDHLYRRRQTLLLWNTKETFGAEWRVEMTNGLPWPRVLGTTNTRQRKVPPKFTMRELGKRKEPPLSSRVSWKLCTNKNYAK